jgi:hypothetical protein
MAETRRCKHCQQTFHYRPQNPDQQYCSQQVCQQARKRNWHRQKLLTDADYRANQRDAGHCWQEKNPDYWRKYRETHPDYARRNRERQQERNRRRREQNSSEVPIAKMDASNPASPFSSGRYQLRRVDTDLIAKMDALIVEINVVSSA